tara:strand:- start:246 stop:1364 length:1119 start_codon:yes stop_codon:yes gene_type:complete
MSVFQYNPDKHVRIAYTPNINDPERTPINTKIAKLGIKKGNSIVTKSGKLRGTKTGIMNRKTISDLKYQRSRMKGKKDEEKIIDNADADTDDAADTDDDDDDADVDISPKKIEDIVTEVIPPADYFYLFDKFKSVHYEKLHKITTDLYSEKHDMDIAFNIHEQHKTIEDADIYRHKHKEDTPYTIHTIQNNNWVFTGPWEENRERMEYYNKNTSVMEAIMDQNHEDSKMIKDMVHNRVRIAKEENIKEVGPDDSSFIKYKSLNKPEVAKMGAISINDTKYADDDDEYFKEDDRRITKKRKRNKNENKTTNINTIPIVPENKSIEVGVISISKGGKNVTKGTMHTRAFAPNEKKGATPTDSDKIMELKNKINN